MTSRTVAQKMGVKLDSRTWLQNMPPDVRESVGMPELRITAACNGEFDYLHLFVTTRADLDATFPQLREHLRLGGALWISWPKGGKLGTDLSLHHVIRIGYNHGLVESTCLSVNSTWSGLKFTHPKPGKIYENSHAE